MLTLKQRQERATRRRVANERREPVCCLFCGRDTTHPYGICAACVGGGRGQWDGQMRGRKSLPVRAIPLEDDYSEESDADSVCDDFGRELLRGRIVL